MSDKTSKRVRAKSALKPEQQTADIVSGEGSDADIRARCAAEVSGWDVLKPKQQDEMVRLMRVLWEMPPSQRMELIRTPDLTTIGAPEGANASLFALRLSETFASESDAYTTDRLADLTKCLSAVGDCDSRGLSAAVAFVHGAKPRDPVQSSLAVQMTATHDAAMRALERFNRAEHVPQAQLFGNMANKLLNTFTRQAEVLAKLQRGGEQVIKHVHVDNRGGQAVIAEQFVTGGSSENRREQSYEQGPFGAALLGADAIGAGLPVTIDEGQRALPSSRRS